MSETSKQSEQPVRDGLRSLHLNLKIIHSGLMVAVAALERQNADHDEDIARTLAHLVGDRLVAQIELAADLMASLPTPDPVTDEPYPAVKPRGVRDSKLLSARNPPGSAPH